MIRTIVITSIALLMLGCASPAVQSTPDGWKQFIDNELPLLGHRNWLLVVDKAFPAQTGTGITVVNSGEPLLAVLDYVMQQVEQSSHITPILYTDRELAYITPEMVPGIEEFRGRLYSKLGGYELQTLLHDEVFLKIDEASSLFRVLVIKTEETIPYSSVFLELDCAYWTPAQEALLREQMANPF